jgi:hypothetical protein
MARLARRDQAWQGPAGAAIFFLLARRGVAGESRHGLARVGEARQDKARQARHGLAGPGMARQDKAGMARERQ